MTNSQILKFGLPTLPNIKPMLKMKNTRPIWITLTVVLTLTIIFAASAAADESTLDGMDGDGSEENPYVISDSEELQAMNADYDAHYVLGTDIDASETETWNAGAGFEPIGGVNRGYVASDPFAGSLDGQGHTIEGLSIDRPNEGYIALFSSLQGTVEDLSLENTEVRGESAAAVVGRLEGGYVSSVYAGGTVEGDREAAGLVASSGRDAGDTLDRSGSTVDVTGGQYHAGGLVGFAGGIQITNSYTTGDVAGDSGETGGISGNLLRFSTIRNSYATGDAIDQDDEGYLGGLTGLNSGPVTDSYSTGDVSGGDSTDGLAWDDDGSVTDGYWNSQLSSYPEGEGTALRTNEMTGSDAKANMAGLDFDNFWTLTDDYPVLEWQVQDVSISLDDSTVGQGQQTAATVTLSLDDGSTVTASEVADYDAGGIADIDTGVVDTSEQGTTEITATVAGESDSTELEVVEPPNIELEDANVDASAVVEDGPLTATATYENDGGPGSDTVELTADGEVVDTQSVSLEADDTTDVDFEWTPDGAVGDEYDVAVDGTDLGSITVVEPGTVSLESVSFPEQVGSSAPYEFTVDLENAADETVIDTVAYELDGDRTTTEPVAVDPDGSTAVLSDETDVDIGLTIAHAVTVDSETLEGTSHVTDPPEFDITAVETPDTVEPDEEFDLSVMVENTGGVEGTQSVVVSDDDGRVVTDALTLEAGESESLSLSVSETASGESEYTVETDTDEASASVAVSEADADSDDSDSVSGFGAVIAAASLAIAAALGPLRRRT
ncbi:hypothetical protein GS429_14560 [Natronorubrum sp. JWXQ-INN-674]|uniref:GLUG domain-containing protein n=2 Tax=Natronorubrum halalkaliphilum TaxID=2691917 RepID=A0A6B0VPQ7_9EURY|nr:hypothetical protein [Natronorubrum halalkaliphilum]